MDTLNGLLGDKEALRKVLLRHVIPGRWVTFQYSAGDRNGDTDVGKWGCRVTFQCSAERAQREVPRLTSLGVGRGT